MRFFGRLAKPFWAPIVWPVGPSKPGFAKNARIGIMVSLSCKIDSLICQLERLERLFSVAAAVAHCTANIRHALFKPMEIKKLTLISSGNIIRACWT
jgi:hypothetical protein